MYTIKFKVVGPVMTEPRILL